jgi:hypothetical protein
VTSNCLESSAFAVFSPDVVWDTILPDASVTVTVMEPSAFVVVVVVSEDVSELLLLEDEDAVVLSPL